MEANMTEVVRELIDFIEENNISDIHNIYWLTDEDCYIDSDRSSEMQELLQRVEESLGDE